MDDSWMRLVWALPMVLLLGLGIILILWRLLGATSLQHKAPRLAVLESLAVGEATTLHLIVADGRTAVLVETSGHGSHLEQMPATQRPLNATRLGWPLR
jgi:flagellar biogenesis protein FliO